MVEFPGSRMTGEGLPLLVDLVDRRIIRVLGRAAVFAGTATAVSNRISRRQAGRWTAAQEQQPAYAQQPPTPAPETAPVQDDSDRKIAQLKELSELKSQGVLSEAEFQAEKARTLGES